MTVNRKPMANNTERGLYESFDNRSVVKPTTRKALTVQDIDTTGVVVSSERIDPTVCDRVLRGVKAIEAMEGKNIAFE